MSWHIYAWLEDGHPCLQIVDSATRKVCLCWKHAEQGCCEKKEIQNLFRELLLLTCKQEISNVRVFDAVGLGASALGKPATPRRPVRAMPDYVGQQN